MTDYPHGDTVCAGCHACQPERFASVSAAGCGCRVCNPTRLRLTAVMGQEEADRDRRIFERGKEAGRAERRDWECESVALIDAWLDECGWFGHWLVNVDEGVARCRICRSLYFCSHATKDQLERWILK